jgi:hypothetical protein
MKHCNKCGANSVNEICDECKKNRYIKVMNDSNDMVIGIVDNYLNPIFFNAPINETVYEQYYHTKDYSVINDIKKEILALPIKVSDFWGNLVYLKINEVLRRYQSMEKIYNYTSRIESVGQISCQIEMKDFTRLNFKIAWSGQ